MHRATDTNLNNTWHHVSWRRAGNPVVRTDRDQTALVRQHTGPNLPRCSRASPDRRAVPYF